jgi:putative ABC transport system permease protein
MGGLIGIILGYSCPPVVRTARQALKWYKPEMIQALPDVIRDVDPIIVPASVPLAFGISVVIGIVFGLYPAYRAAQMDPIEALRHE